MDVINKLKEINLKNKIKAIIETENKNISKNKEENQKNLEIISEYIIHLGKEAKDFNSFNSSLLGEFPEKVIHNIYNLIKEANLSSSGEKVGNKLKDNNNSDLLSYKSKFETNFNNLFIF